jgi:uncharacterized protein YraI
MPPTDSVTPRTHRKIARGILLGLITTGASVLPSTTADANTTAVVRTSSGPLRVRAAATTLSPQIGSLPNGSRAALACAVTGQSVRGTVRSTTQWDRLATGGYVSHGYISGAALPSCPDPSVPAADPTSGGTPASALAGTVNTGGGALRMRTGPSTLTPQGGSVNNGAGLSIACQVDGETIRTTSGVSRQWDRLATGLYVAHAYVRTTAAIPACPTGAPVVTVPPPSPTTVTGTVRSNDGPINIRSGASTASVVVGRAANGSSLTISCQVIGTVVSGTVSTTAQWDRLASGYYLSHAYVSSPAIPVCAGGTNTVTPEPNGSMTRAQFIAASVAPAQRTYREYGVPASVVIVQAILESNWGRSGLAATDHNYFGIKCANGGRGQVAIGCHSYTTTECTPICHLTVASFRSYATVTDSFRDHATFLTTNSRYRPAFGYTRDADQFLYQVWKAGYATDPCYTTKLTALMHTYNLYQYDQV